MVILVALPERTSPMCNPFVPEARVMTLLPEMVLADAAVGVAVAIPPKITVGVPLLGWV